MKVACCVHFEGVYGLREGGGGPLYRWNVCRVLGYSRPAAFWNDNPFVGFSERANIGALT